MKESDPYECRPLTDEDSERSIAKLNQFITGTFTLEADVAKELLKAGAKEVDGFIMPYGEYAFAPPDPNEPEHPPIQSENEQ